MVISNALPVQFWTDSSQSFNNKSVCGIEPICFCQPFECDDEINLQFTDQNEVTQVPETITLPDTPALSSFLSSTLSSNPNWTTGATPSITLTAGQTSEWLYVDYAFLAGYDYSLTLQFTRTDNEASLNPRTATLVISDSSFNIEFTTTSASSSGANSISISFTATNDSSRIAFRFNSGSNRTITATSFSGTRTGLSIPADPGPKSYSLRILDENLAELTTIPFDSLYLGNYNHLYLLSVVPSVEGICNEKVYFRIYLNDASPGDVAYSDCLSIRTTHDCTLPITYSNSRNFAGLTYEDASPVTTHTLRIPAIFFEEDNPAEQEDHELSNGEIVRLYNKMERRRKLDVGFLPHYLHEKLQLVLMHDTVVIDDLEWIRREAYEKIEGNKRYPLRRASVFLHDKNFIKENQL